MNMYALLRLLGASLLGAAALPACAQGDEVTSHIPVEPFAGGGVFVSMTVAEASERLEQLGFTGDRCVYQRAVADTARSDVVRLDTRRACVDDALVTRVAFSGVHVGSFYGASDADDLMERLTKAVGPERRCQPVADNHASCRWNAPDSSPLALSIYAYVQPGRISVEVISWPTHERPTGRFALKGPDPFGDLDPAAPLGIKPGMTIGALDARLVELGFETAFNDRRARCSWLIVLPGEARIEVSSGAPAQCDQDRPMEKLSIHLTEERRELIETAPDPAEMRRRFAAVLGPPSEGQVCPERVEDLPRGNITCEWNDPELSGVVHARMRYTPGDLDKSGPRSTFEYKIDYPDSDWRRPTTKSPSAAEREEARRAAEKRKADEAAARREACGEPDESKPVDADYLNCMAQYSGR